LSLVGYERDAIIELGGPALADEIEVISQTTAPLTSPVEQGALRALPQLPEQASVKPADARCHPTGSIRSEQTACGFTTPPFTGWLLFQPINQRCRCRRPQLTKTRSWSTYGLLHPGIDCRTGNTRAVQPGHHPRRNHHHTVTPAAIGAAKRLHGKGLINQPRRWLPISLGLTPLSTHKALLTILNVTEAA
jgi:hypothetical protein